MSRSPESETTERMDEERWLQLLADEEWESLRESITTCLRTTDDRARWALSTLIYGECAVGGRYGGVKAIVRVHGYSSTEIYDLSFGMVRLGVRSPRAPSRTPDFRAWIVDAVVVHVVCVLRSC